MDKKLERYAFPVPKLELNDMQAGLESFDFIKSFLSKTLLTIDNIKNNLHIFNTLYRGENINELKELLSVKNSLNKVIENYDYVDIKNKKYFLATASSLRATADTNSIESPRCMNTHRNHDTLHHTPKIVL